MSVKFSSRANAHKWVNFDLKDEYLTPVTARQMIARICANLQQIYQRLHQTEDATRWQRYLVALSR